MSLPTSLLSYKDCADTFEKTLLSPQGIRVRMPSFEKANFFRMRCHYFRTLDRRNNARIYESDHAMHGCSQFDPVVLKIRLIDSQFWLYFERQEQLEFAFEEITEKAEYIDYKPPLQITIQRQDGSTVEGELIPPGQKLLRRV